MEQALGSQRRSVSSGLSAEVGRVHLVKNFSPTPFVDGLVGDRGTRRDRELGHEAGVRVGT